MSTTYTEQDHQQHLAQEHKISTTASYVSELVYGGNDGIVTTFAVVAGFTGANSGDVAQFTFLSVLLFGLANLFADGTSMGLGNFLSVRSEKEVYAAAKAKELQEIRDEQSDEYAETIHLLRAKGYSESDAITMADLYKKNEGYWLDFMMHHELELSNPEKESATRNGLATFASFIFFGFIPLIPYLFVEELAPAFIGSCVATFIALMLLGTLRWKVSGQKLWKTLGESLLIGGTSAVIAFLVGIFFRG
jgi:VIT1/CCC1 family predicted Fe2+/Mn2+ transporter